MQPRHLADNVAVHHRGIHKIEKYLMPSLVAAALATVASAQVVADVNSSLIIWVSLVGGATLPSLATHRQFAVAQ